jgi:hypothetical protein
MPGKPVRPGRSINRAALVMIAILVLAVTGVVLLNSQEDEPPAGDPESETLGDLTDWVAIRDEAYLEIAQKQWGKAHVDEPVLSWEPSKAGPPSSTIPPQAALPEQLQQVDPLIGRVGECQVLEPDTYVADTRPAEAVAEIGCRAAGAGGARLYVTKYSSPEAATQASEGFASLGSSTNFATADGDAAQATVDVASTNGPLQAVSFHLGGETYPMDVTFELVGSISEGDLLNAVSPA